MGLETKFPNRIKTVYILYYTYAAIQSMTSSDIADAELQ